MYAKSIIVHIYKIACVIFINNEDKSNIICEKIYVL